MFLYKNELDEGQVFYAAVEDNSFYVGEMFEKLQLCLKRVQNIPEGCDEPIHIDRPKLDRCLSYFSRTRRPDSRTRLEHELSCVIMQHYFDDTIV